MACPIRTSPAPCRSPDPPCSSGVNASWRCDCRAGLCVETTPRRRRQAGGDESIRPFGERRPDRQASPRKPAIDVPNRRAHAGIDLGKIRKKTVSGCPDDQGSHWGRPISPRRAPPRGSRRWACVLAPDCQYLSNPESFRKATSYLCRLPGASHVYALDSAFSLMVPSTVHAKYRLMQCMPPGSNGGLS
jgi:hypothetical protein